MAEEEVSSVVREKLMPGEAVVAQVRANVSDLVATDKRLLRFSSNGYEALDYSDVSSIKYGSSTGRKVSSRVIVVFCDIILIAIAIGIWVAYFDETVRNVTTSIAVTLSILVGIFVLLSILFVFAHDYGYYQIESSKIGKDMEKYYRLTRPPFGGSRVDKFVNAVSAQGNITLDRKK